MQKNFANVLKNFFPKKLSNRRKAIELTMDVFVLLLTFHSIAKKLRKKS